MKMYKKPIAEVYDLKGGNLMLSVSPGTPPDPTNPPVPGAPKRGDIIE